MMFIDLIQTSDRNKMLLKDYISGLKRADLAIKYNITTARVSQIIEYDLRLIRTYKLKKCSN